LLFNSHFALNSELNPCLVLADKKPDTFTGLTGFLIEGCTGRRANMNTADEFREALDDVPIESIIALNAAANYLSKVPHASKRLQYVADTIVKYLKGKEPTLDRAFGFTKGRGKYERGDREKHIAQVFAALNMRIDGKSWKAISELHGCDEKEFRHRWNRYKSQALERFVKEKIDPAWNTPGP
jgi:hypothetical protein